MRKLLLWGMLGLAGVVRAEDFTTTMTPEERAATGVDRLTPAELARLKVVVERYKTGEVAAVRQEAATQVAAVKQEAEQKIVAAETKAVVAETKAQVAERKVAETKAPVASGQKQPGWFSALLTLNRASEKPDEAEAMEGTLVGEFGGWNGGTIFKLDNGTEWVQQNRGESYEYSPPLRSPRVKIFPASVAGFWLEIAGVNTRVRVKPYKLTGAK